MSNTEKRELRCLFRNYTRLTKTMLKTLKVYGLVLVDDGKHYKVFRTDKIGGFVVMAKTPSDFRASRNLCHNLIHLLEA